MADCMREAKRRAPHAARTPGDFETMHIPGALLAHCLSADLAPVIHPGLFFFSFFFLNGRLLLTALTKYVLFK